MNIWPGYVASRRHRRLVTAIRIDTTPARVSFHSVQALYLNMSVAQPEFNLRVGLRNTCMLINARYININGCSSAGHLPFASHFARAGDAASPSADMTK